MPMLGRSAAVGGAGAALLLLFSKATGSWGRRHREHAILEELRQLFQVPLAQVERLRDAMVQQMQAGLEGKPGGLLMLPSYVDILPSGEEEGEYFAIDLGGTNLRVARVRLGAEVGVVAELEVREWPIPERCFDTDSGALLAYVAECSGEVLGAAGAAVTVAEAAAGAAPPVIGFCFSFAFEQTALGNGKLLRWTKNFRGRALIGEDVVAALVAAFAARGLAVSVPALMNDTVATLVALRYEEPATAAGIILGTGTNCAYLEAIERIPKLPAGYVGRGAEMVVNTEWGDVRGGAGVLPTCEEDTWVDCSSANPGLGLYEKRIAGLYMGELARRLLLRLAGEGGLFGAGRPPRGLAMHGAFDSADLAAAAEDDAPGLPAVGATLAAAFGLRKTSGHQRAVAREVCRLVALRSARLCAAGIAAVLLRMGRDPREAAQGPVVIAVDGSVFAKFGYFRALLGEALAELYGEVGASRVALRLVRDGSVLGAAHLAAAADHWGRAGSSRA